MPSDTSLPADDGRAGRLPPIPPEAMTAEQKRVVDGIVGGPRGGLRGPFPAMLRSPEVAERFQKLGEYLRFNSSIPTALNELAILVTAREWSAQYEWYAHHLLAMKAGLPPAIAEAVAAGPQAGRHGCRPGAGLAILHRVAQDQAGLGRDLCRDEGPLRRSAASSI